MGDGLSNSARLIRTETMHHMNDINLAHMKEAGVTQVKEIVTLDERTSSTCKVHNNKIHDIDKAPILPRHPNCRCVLVAHIDVDKMVEEFDRREAEINGYNNDIIPLTDKELIYTTPYDTILTTDNYLNWEKSITHQESVDILDYTGTKYYSEMNGLLRGKLNFDSDLEYKNELINKINRLDSALSRFTTEEQYTVYRGTYRRYGVENVKIGESFILDKGFASSSFAQSITDDFSGTDGDVLYRIRIPKGKNVGAYIDKLSKYRGEEEFLFRPHTKVKLLKIDKRERTYGFQWVYDVEVE